MDKNKYINDILDIDFHKLELVSKEDGVSFDTITILDDASEITLYAMEYYNNDKKKWMLRYTASKVEYDNYLNWARNPVLTPEEMKARRKMMEKLTSDS